MYCVFCGGDVVSKHVTFIYEQDEHLLVIKNVPAEVCAKCGERTYSPETTDEIMQFAKQYLATGQFYASDASPTNEFVAAT